MFGIVFSLKDIIKIYLFKRCGMTTILFRTFFMYAIIIFSMKIMGKRQMGQMQISEFVTAMILSELAALPIADKNIPILYCIIPLIIIISSEVIMSFISLKSANAQSFLESDPTVIIDKGVLNQKALRDTRVTINELLVELRIAGLSSISEAEYVFLEPNGKFSVIPKAPFRQVTVSDLSLDVQETEPDVVLVSDGKIIKSSLDYLSKNEIWLLKSINPNQLSDILLFSCNKSGKKTIIIKETKM